MTVVGFAEVESGLVELPDLQGSPKDGPAELGTLCQPRARAEVVPEDDTDLDNGLLFGEPCVPGLEVGGPAWRQRVSLERKGSTDERKHGWGVAYPEWAGLVGWPVLSNPSLDEKRALPAEIEDFGVLRLPCASDPS